MREGTTDCVPLPQVSLTKEGEVSIQDKIDDLIRGIAIEAITEPIQCHLGGCHGVAHVPLQFEQVVVVESECFCHAPIISTGFGRSLVLVCHLANWSGAADQFFIQTHAMLQYHKPKEMWACKLFITWHVWFMRMHTKNATMYTLHDRILKCG